MGTQFFFVTGADTGVGKTVVAALLTRHLRAEGVRVAALKPVCSGGQGDARHLWAASAGALSLEEVNPWHYRAALAPVLAARRERRRVGLADVVRHVNRISRDFEVVVVEGAGGLLSPLGEGFDSRALLVALGARPLVVAPNKLGAIGQVRLVLAALPRRIAAAAGVVLVTPAKRDRAFRTNATLLAEFISRSQIHLLPQLTDPFPARLTASLRRTMARLETGGSVEAGWAGTSCLAGAAS